jgi:hypothetical protein
MLLQKKKLVSHPLRKRVKHHERCKIVKSETPPSGVSDFIAIATSKEKAEFPYQLLNIRGKPWITVTGFPEDLLPLRHPSQFDIDGLKRIISRRHKI